MFLFVCCGFFKYGSNLLIAREEGFDKLAFQFEAVGAIEKRHQERYEELFKLLKKQKVFKKTDKQIWICRNCGHIHVGKEAPKMCPVCAHPQAYFELFVEKF